MGRSYVDLQAGQYRCNPLLEVATGKQLQATAKIAHLGYALMPYRLNTYDAVASLALSSDASTNRRSVATL
jgi:hypothetical protein